MTPIGHLPPVMTPSHDVTRMTDPSRQTDDQRERVENEFEGIFISMLLKQMRATIGGDGLFGKDASDIHGGLFDLYMGKHLASGEALGVGKLVGQYLEAEKLARQSLETEKSVGVSESS